MSKSSETPPAGGGKPQRSIWPLWAALLVSLAPVVAAVVLYLNPQWVPSDRYNYGTLLDPQLPVPAPVDLTLATLDGEPFDLRDERGQWLMLTVDQATCPESCARKLFIMRQTHASTGRNVHRIERVWLITDDESVPEEVLEAYRGTLMLRVADRSQLDAFLGPAVLEDHIWVIDPLNNLMMRFPEDPDPIQLRRDIGRLLFASQVG